VGSRWKFKPSRTALSFIRTLSDFVETALSAGSLRETRKGPEWYVGDLANRPGDSCHVNLVTGVYHDFSLNEGGGPEKLFARVFGIDPEDREAVGAGIAAWVERGELPDGSGIGAPPERIVLRKPPRRTVTPTNSAEEAEKWARIVAENATHLPEIASLLASYRGLSVEVFEWLLREGAIGISDGPWYSGKTRREFYDPRIVFPVVWKNGGGDRFLRDPRPVVRTGRAKRLAVLPRTHPGPPLYPRGSPLGGTSHNRGVELGCACGDRPFRTAYLDGGGWSLGRPSNPGARPIRATSLSTRSAPPLPSSSSSKTTPPAASF
jgi:hypothetical protein